MTTWVQEVSFLEKLTDGSCLDMGSTLGKEDKRNLNRQRYVLFLPGTIRVTLATILQCLEVAVKQTPSLELWWARYTTSLRQMSTTVIALFLLPFVRFNKFQRGQDPIILVLSDDLLDARILAYCLKASFDLGAGHKLKVKLDLLFDHVCLLETGWHHIDPLVMLPIVLNSIENIAAPSVLLATAPFLLLPR